METHLHLSLRQAVAMASVAGADPAQAERIKAININVLNKVCFVFIILLLFR